ncbi:hypothetical protein TKK_0011551 [Trichogramma kaykai]|uniref:Uncharacterized protein n=1 Tax=Trichogramma kaykai TaxID=54128 RepID=A0ABD2WQR4_9HYME
MYTMLFECYRDLAGLLDLLNEVRPVSSSPINGTGWRIGVAMLRVYLREIQASRPLDSQASAWPDSQASAPLDLHWPVYVAEESDCHQEDWDPELSGFRCPVCFRRLDDPPPDSANSYYQEAIPRLDFLDGVVEEVHLSRAVSVSEIVALDLSLDDRDGEMFVRSSYDVLSDGCDNGSEGPESSF